MRPKSAPLTDAASETTLAEMAKKQPTREELEAAAKTLGIDLDALTPKQREALQTLRPAIDDKQEAVREWASQGGKARAEALTPAQRSEIARKAVQARIAKLTPEQASQAARKGAQAAGKAHKRKARQKRLDQIKQSKKKSD